RVYTAFPGLKSAFRTDFVLSDDAVITLTQRDLLPLDKAKLYEPRLRVLVDVIVEKLRVLADKTTAPDVIIVALPTTIRKLVTVPSRHKHARKPRKAATTPQTSLFDLLSGPV